MEVSTIGDICKNESVALKANLKQDFKNILSNDNIAGISTLIIIILKGKIFIRCQYSGMFPTKKKKAASGLE